MYNPKDAISQVVCCWVRVTSSLRMLAKHEGQKPKANILIFDHGVHRLLIIGLFDLRKLLNLVIKLLFVLHGFSTMTSSIKILLFDLPGFNPGFKIILKLLKVPPEVVFTFGFQVLQISFSTDYQSLNNSFKNSKGGKILAPPSAVIQDAKNCRFKIYISQFDKNFEQIEQQQSSSYQVLQTWVRLLEPKTNPARTQRTQLLVSFIKSNRTTDKKLNVNKPCVTSQKTAFRKFCKIFCQFSSCHKFW